MSNRYALRIRLETYEYEGAFYLIGDGYETPGEVLQNVGADHILRIDEARQVESYLLDVLQEGENVSEDEYEAWDAAVSCGVHADIYYRKYSFWTGERVVEIGREPTDAELREIGIDPADNTTGDDEPPDALQ